MINGSNRQRPCRPSRKSSNRFGSHFCAPPCFCQEFGLAVAVSPILWLSDRGCDVAKKSQRKIFRRNSLNSNSPARTPHLRSSLSATFAPVEARLGRNSTPPLIATVEFSVNYVLHQ